jgi:hypothetical protein
MLSFYSRRPSQILRLGFRSLVSAKLSKLLNQENALSAPCLRGGFGSPQAPSWSKGMLRTGVISHCHIFV